MAAAERTYWLREIAGLDPVRDYERIYRITGQHEFPWDLNQALSFALFRTYAVPSIGSLLYRTGEFTERTQKRYDDTALILDAPFEHGLDSVVGHRGIRRMNQMHRMYHIPNDELLYVLCTFVVVPIRWVTEHGWRPLVEAERVAMAQYYRHLGRLMGIRGIPETWQGLAEHMDAYEAEHFGFDAGGRAVADATLDLMTTFPPNDRAPARAVRRFSYALMDTLLLDAFDYPHPTAVERVGARRALRARSWFVRQRPPRMEPSMARDQPGIRSYSPGLDVATLGTFAPAPGECPVPHAGGHNRRHA